MSYRMDDEEYDAYHRDYESEEMLDDCKGDLLAESLNNRLRQISPTPKIMGYLGVTFNAPKTKAFTNKNSAKQKDYYRKIWHKVKCTFGEPVEAEYVYEVDKNGQVHLHGYITVHSKCYIMGAVSDLAKAYLQFMPARHQNFNLHGVYPDYSRYRYDGVCVQWYDVEDDEFNGDVKSTIKHWKEYMQKAQLN